MIPQDNLPQPPASLNLTWRALHLADQAALTRLAADCQAVDGGQAQLSAAAYRVEDASPHATIAAFDANGRLLGAAAVRLEQTPHEQRANIVGQVHPSARGRGIGTFLIAWSVAQARALLSSCSGDLPRTLRLTSEALTTTAARLYARHGFTQQFAEDVMRRDLGDALPDRPLPPTVTLASWTPALADQFFGMYQAAFRERPGFPGWSAAEWIDWATGDDDFRPAMSLLARAGELPIGFIVCADAWIVQVGVRPEWRGRGLGAALVVAALGRFQAAGCDHVMLDVNVNNPGAAHVYQQLGFAVVGRRARYTLALAKSL